MSEAVVVNTIEQIVQFLRANGVEDGTMEIVFRQAKGKYKTFQKVIVSDLTKSKEKELAQKVANSLSKLTELSQGSLDLLGNVAKLEQFGLILNGLNLCATCAGFAIMYMKLDAMSEQLSAKIDQVRSAVRSSQDLKNDFEFNKVLAKHTDMLDSQRRAQPYSEQEMRKLVDREYNVLTLLVSTLQKDVSEDQGPLIFSIFSLLSMLTVSLCKFDEIYYSNNSQALSGTDVWHLSHDKWMAVYATLSAPWFVEKVQDYGVFEANLSMPEVDVYYTNLIEQVGDLREQVQDSQRLIIAMGDMNLYEQCKELSAKVVADSIEAAFREAGAGMDEEVVTAAYEDAMRQVAMV